MRQKHQHDDADAFGEKGLLKDERSVRVSLFMRDADSLSPLQRAVAQSSVSVTDGAAHRPGFRLADADARSTTALDAAYSEYEEALASAWRDADLTGAGERGQQGSREGDSCMRDGLAGVLRMGAAGLYCDIGDDEPDDDAEISQEWRRK
jgi:hypothetical protein